jgi:protein-tyrosine phosphatase
MPGRAELHFHALPGVDDGPATLEETIALTKLALEDGTLTIVATPHVCDIDVGELDERVREVCAELARERLPVELIAGGETAADDVARLTQAELAAVAQGPQGARWVLLESPHNGDADAFSAAADEVRARGFGVLIAHPERSAALDHGRSAVVQRELAFGSWLQVNGMSVLGRYGERVRGAALQLLAQEEHVILSSDAHSPTRPPCISDAIRRARSDGVPAKRLQRAGNIGPRALLRRGLRSRGSLLA